MFKGFLNTFFAHGKLSAEDREDLENIFKINRIAGRLIMDRSDPSVVLAAAAREFLARDNAKSEKDLSDERLREYREVVLAGLGTDKEYDSAARKARGVHKRTLQNVRRLTSDGRAKWAAELGKGRSADAAISTFGLKQVDQLPRKG